MIASTRERHPAIVFKLPRSAERHRQGLYVPDRLAEIVRGVRFRDDDSVTACEDQPLPDLILQIGHTHDTTGGARDNLSWPTPAVRGKHDWR